MFIKINNLKGTMMIAVAVFCSTFFLGSCSEDIDESNLYTFTGETILDYLSHREDFSDFKYIVERAGMGHQMSAYGSYTCFAPTNSAVKEYIDSLYDDTKNVDLPHNGMTERSLEGLSDSLCKDIALYHFANTEIMGVGMSNGMTINTILGREVNTSIDPATGQTVINTYSAIVSMDNELENGVLHEINHVIRRSNSLVSGELMQHPEFSIFSEALQITGLADSLNMQRKEGIDKLNTTYGYYVPQECKVGFTIFAETNDVLAAEGITNLEQLAAKANEIYAHCADEYDNVKRTGWYDYARNNNIKISTGNDYKNPWNCLNMFIRYHILKFSASYDRLFFSANEVAGVTLYEYYETMLPYTLMKLEYFKGQNKKAINPWFLNNTLTDRVAQLGSSAIRIEKKPGIVIQSDNISAFNGYIHPISGLVVYDYDVPNGTLQERMRFDVLSLLDELMSTGIRGITEKEIIARRGPEAGKDPGLEDGGYARIPTNFCNNLVIYNGENTRLYYLPGKEFDWANYQKDEFNCLGAFDFAFRLPPVPDGTYEIRLGYTAEPKRGMLQFYMGSSSELTSMTALDIPLDMRVVPIVNADGSPDITTGWCDWTKTDDQGVESDAAMRNLGYMRGPLYYTVNGKPVREHAKDLRRIITHRTLKQSDYWLRFKSVLPKNTSTQFHLDYIEICPEKVYNSTTYIEDMY